MSSYRTQHGVEVDFILEKNNELIAIEVKASKNISTQDLHGLKSLSQYVGGKCR